MLRGGRMVERRISRDRGGLAWELQVHVIRGPTTLFHIDGSGSAAIGAEKSYQGRVLMGQITSPTSVWLTIIRDGNLQVTPYYLV